LNENPPQKRVLVITGPTASGKTGIAEKIASDLGMSIVSADSRQVYRFLDIGTAKPAKDSPVRYHLIDFLHPKEKYSASRFIEEADDVLARESALICGGTGFYIRALSEGLFQGDYSSEDLRKELGEDNASALHKRLTEVDPEAAAGIHPNNKIRVIRALEVFMLSGKPISQHWRESREKRSKHTFIKIGIRHDRDTLRKRIMNRTIAMLEQGWIEEVENLLAEGFDTKWPGMQSLGYPLIVDYLNGMMNR